jgi:hypothetical protein
MHFLHVKPRSFVPPSYFAQARPSEAFYQYKLPRSDELDPGKPQTSLAYRWIAMKHGAWTIAPRGWVVTHALYVILLVAMLFWWINASLIAIAVARVATLILAAAM